jgi:ABC-type multidrug transport system ATPase subunit
MVAQGLSVRAGPRTLLENASFTIAPGQLTVLIGVSGSGKSTLLRILAALEPKQAQTEAILWSGDVALQPADLHDRIGLVFQQPALLDEWSGLQNIRLAMDHRWKPPGSHNGAAANSDEPASAQARHLYFTRDPTKWLEYLHVPVGVRISRLSGGQRQRLSLAQTLAGQPALLIYDEPTTGLDAVSAQRVADLIRDVQSNLTLTSLVVTHDYESFLPVADQVLILDATERSIRIATDNAVESVRREMQRQIGILQTNQPQPAKSLAEDQMVAKSAWAYWRDKAMKGGWHALVAVGQGAEWLALGVLALVPRWRHPGWGLRFLLHYARLVTGPTAIVYLIGAGLIVGFVATYFTLKHMPYKVYTQPLLMEELLAAIGFALYRIFVPVLTTILIAARCAAAVSADLGNKRYGGQIESLRMLRVSPEQYLWFGVMWSFLIGSLLLNQVAWMAAKTTSLAVHAGMQPGLGSAYWDVFFHQLLRQGPSWIYQGYPWLSLKLLLCGFGTGLLTWCFAMRPKLASTDISRSITSTILWSTLWVLLVHLLVALWEFRGQS